MRAAYLLSKKDIRGSAFVSHPSSIVLNIIGELKAHIVVDVFVEPHRALPRAILSISTPASETRVV